MNVGEVVRYDRKRWRVLSHSQELRMCELINFDLERIEVPDDLDKGLELKVLYNPGNWPFVSIPVKTSFGRILNVTRSVMDNVAEGKSETLTLTPMVDWVPGDFLKAGGSIFFNPALRLMPGMTLVAIHENARTQRINITRGFGSMKTRVKREEKPKVPENNYQRIMMDDVFGED